MNVETHGQTPTATKANPMKQIEPHDHHIFYKREEERDRAEAIHFDKITCEEFERGRDYWWQYQKLNGYAFRPNEQGLKILSRNLDLNISHLRKHINKFLEA